MVSKSALAVAAALSLLLVWAPLPFGSVGPSAGAALSVGVGLALLLAASVGPLAGPLRRVLLPFAACLAIAVLGLAASLTYSIGPGESRAAALSWLMPSGALLAGASAGVSRRCRRVLGAAFGAVLVFEVIYGVRQWLVGSHHIWGVFVQSQTQRLKGTFVNPNHLATLLCLGLAAAGAWCWWALRRAPAERRAAVRVMLFGPPLLVAAALLVALVLTGSRSGMLAAAAGGTAQVVVVLSHRNRRRLILPVLVAGMVLSVAVVASTAGRRAFDRVLQTRLADVSLGARAEAARASLGLVARRPALGSGLGTFEDAFAQVVPVSAVEKAWPHLHNDPLEMLVTTGLVGLGLLLAGAAALWRSLSRVSLHGSSSEDRAAGLFGLGAMAALAAQELFEFGLTIPANAFAAATLLGAAAAARLRPESRDLSRP